MPTFMAAAITAHGCSAATASQVQTIQVMFRQRAPMPTLQIGKPKISESNTDKMFNAIPNSFKHAANLPIDSLLQHNAQTRGRDGVKLYNFCSLAVEKNSAQQFRGECEVPRPIQRHLIFLVDLVTRMCKSLRQLAVVCQKNQTFSLCVQTADVEEAR